MIPLISICIANYNKSSFIVQCLNSIISAEKYPNKEIILIDDASSDNSLEIIKDWIEKHKDKIKVTLLINKKNSGPGYTYNQAIKNANGEYITFMDSDDFFIESTLEEKLKLFEKNPLQKIVYGNGVFFENNEFWNVGIHINITQTFENAWYNPERIFEHICAKIPLLSLSSALIKKEFFLKIGGFDEAIFSNDWIGNIKIFSSLTDSKEFSINQTPAFVYRMHENNISKNYDKILFMLLEVIEKYCPPYLKKKAYSNAFFTNALSNISIGNYKKAFSSIKTSVSYEFHFKKILLFSISTIFPIQAILKILPKSFVNFLKSFILRHFQ